ncbi:hypothetical protein PsyrH_25580 [Pseudomonas syringae pv. syringae HS191]|uniref:hypothetical protein n=1 Tax=Pseudomonas syringae TaxID=317 RepID=UPI000624C550|nr:hypothetical protein [Pseudomonas syringae]AKF53813.1 hypothetical protein PsyrH_25580 [Pseudomonas syringae pv. syringae HS191]
MKHHASIELYSPGIVIFDPEVLNEFLKKNKITEPNVFEFFLQHDTLGRLAIEEGILCPIYQIPENEYSIFLLGAPASEQHLYTVKFSYEGFPLKVESGILIASDLNALLDWDPEFFTNYKKNYEQRLSNNDYIEVSSGLYDMTIRGCANLKPPYNNLGYGLDMRQVGKLPDLDTSTSVESHDFSLC